MTNQKCLGALLAACICLSSQMKAISAPDEARDVVTAWKQRHEAINVVRYELSGEIVYTPEFFTEASAGTGIKAVGETIKKPVNLQITVDFRRGLGRIESNWWAARLTGSGLTFDPTSGVSVWDRKSTKEIGKGDPSQYSRKRPQMLISDDPNSRSLHHELDPLFWGHGVFRSTNQKNTAANLWIDHPPGSLELIGKSPSSNQSILRTEPRRLQSARGSRLHDDELLVDLSKQAEIRKVSSRYGETAVGRIAEADYQSVPGSKYSLVKSIRHQKFSNNKLLESCTLDVTQVELEPKLDASAFELIVSPGAYVQHDEKLFLVGADGNWKFLGNDDGVVQAMRMQSSPGSTADSGIKVDQSFLSRNRLNITIVLIVIVALVAIVAIARQSRHRDGV